MKQNDWKTDGDTITGKAKKTAEQHGWTAVSLNEVCAKIDEMKAAGMRIQDMTATLNREQVLRGNYRQGDHHWKDDHVKYVYFQIRGTTISGKRRSSRRKALREARRKEELPGTQLRPKKKVAKSKTPAEATHNARIFRMQNPEYTIWTNEAVAQLVDEAYSKKRNLAWVRDRLNADKILRSTYTRGAAEWTEFSVRYAFVAARGRPPSGRTMKKKSGMSDAISGSTGTQSSRSMTANGYLDLSAVPADDIKMIQLTEDGRVAVRIETTVPYDDCSREVMNRHFESIFSQ